MRTTKNLSALERKSRRMRVTQQRVTENGVRVLTVFDPVAVTVHEVRVHFGQRGRQHTVYAVCDCRWNRGEDGTLRGFGCAHSICALKALGRDKQKTLQFYADPDVARRKRRRLFLWYADEISAENMNSEALSTPLYITSRTSKSEALSRTA